MKNTIQLIRVHQWLKNLFIFAPLFFSGLFLNTEKLYSNLFAFMIFSLNASAIYILNDYKDIESDKHHPTKKNRPLASGAINKTIAILLFVILSITSFTFSFYLNQSFFYVLLTYFLMNVLYSFGLKTVALIDVFIIAIGFVLRVIAGGVVSIVEISHWLYIMTFLLALFLALAKRRDDLLLNNDTIRKSIKGYNLEFINSGISMLCGVLVVSYILYITSTDITNRLHNKYAFLSVIFVMAGLLRYLQITLVEQKSGSPTKILINDSFLKITILLWISFFCILLYIK